MPDLENSVILRRLLCHVLKAALYRFLVVQTHEGNRTFPAYSCGMCMSMCRVSHTPCPFDNVADDDICLIVFVGRVHYSRFFMLHTEYYWSTPYLRQEFRVSLVIRDTQDPSDVCGRSTEEWY